MDDTTENINHEALQDSGNLAINAEWSETSSVFSSSSSNSHINTETYKECCANPSDTLKNKEDFMILESTSTDVNTSNFNINDTHLSTRKVTHFQKPRKPYSSNSHVFDNILADDSEMEITQNSVCLNRFQKRRKLSSPNDNIFVEINKSNNNDGMNSAEVSMMSPKCFSKKIRDQSCFEIPDYNLSTADTTSTLIVDDANVSKVKKYPAFKIPSDSSVLVNDCTYNIMDESKTELLTQKFTRKTIDTVNSAFDNIINDSSITSDNISNVSKNLSCSTMELPSLNHTYDIPAIGNSTQIALSQSVKNNSELLNISIGQPMNETYNLENDIMSNKTNYNESNKSINLKNTYSDTFTIENNSNEALDQPKSTNKTINTLADTSNIYNQSNSSVQKPKFIRKLQLDTVPQDYNITIDENNSTINDNFNKTKNNNISKRFKLQKTGYDGDSKIFDNIIMSSQESETSQNTNISNDNISNTLNVSAETSNDNDLRNISLESKCKKNIEESMDKSLTQESNVLLDEVVETNKSMNQSDFLLKFKSSNSYIRPSGKFNFSKRFGRLSQSYQENNINVDVIKQHTISINTDFNKTLGEKSNILNEFENSKISDNQENHTNSEIIQQFSGLLSSTIPNTSTFQQSQSPTPHFTGKHVITAHSGVFSDLIDHSLNSDSSMNISKQVKFKNHKNVHDDQSIVFENVIKNSQESNFLLNQNDNLSCTVLYDQSTIQGDEISMFANTDELLSNSKSLKNSDYSFKKLDINNTINVKESKFKGNELNDLNITSNDSTESIEEKDSLISNISIVNNKQCNSAEPVVSVIRNNTLCEKNNTLWLEESINNHSLSDINAGLLKNDSLRSNPQTSLSSKSLLASNNTDLCCKSNEIFGDYNSNTSNHSISVNSNNENLLSNKLLLSDDLTNSSSNDEGLTLMITTTGLSESDISLGSNTTSINETNSVSSINETNSVSSRNSVSSTSTNQESTLLNTTAGSLGSTRSSRSQSNSIGSSRYSTRSTLHTEESTLLNNNGSLKQNVSINQSKVSTSKCYSLSANTKDSSNISNISLISIDDKINIGRITTHSSKENENSVNYVESEIYNPSVLLNNDELITLDNSARSPKTNLLVNISKTSTSKYSLPVNTNDVLNTSSISLIPEDNINNSSRISTRSSNQNKNSLIDAEPEVYNADKLLENEGLAILSTAARSSENMAISHSKASTSKYSLPVNTKDVLNTSSKSLMLEDNINNSSRISTRSSNKNKNSFNSVKPEVYNADKLLDNEGLTILNTTARSSENMSSHSKASTSKYSLPVNTKDVLNKSSKSLMPEDNINNSSRISTRSSNQNKNSLNYVEPEVYNADKLLDNEGLTILSTAARSSENMSSHSKASTSKYSLPVNTKDVLNTSSKSLMPEDNINNSSRISTRSSNKNKNSFNSVKPEVYNADKLLDNEGLTILNTTARSSENMSSHLKASTSKNSLPVNTKDVLNTSSKSLMPEDNINNSSRISTRSSIRNKNSLNNTSAISKVTDSLIKKKKSSSTRVTKSSLASTVSKSVLKKTLINSKSMVPENNVNYNVSTLSSRTSKSLINSNNYSDDDSIFWTTISDNTANKPIQNVNIFQTPRNNKLAVEEQIINTIGIMSVNKHKATHPGVFELEDHRPLTRSTRVQTFNQSPSILTRVLAGNNLNETMSDSQSLTETIIDNLHVEETVTIKFKSLYNKEPWITKRLYNFLVNKLLPKYNIFSVKYAEKFIKYLASIMKQVYPQVNDANVDLQLHTDVLRYHMARYGIINDTFDYMGFLTDYIPVPYYRKLMPSETPDAKVKFDQNKNFHPIMEDEEFLNQVLDHLNAA